MQSIVHVVESLWVWGPLKMIFRWFLRDYSFVTTSKVYIIKFTVMNFQENNSKFFSDELSLEK